MKFLKKFASIFLCMTLILQFGNCNMFKGFACKPQFQLSTTPDYKDQCFDVTLDQSGKFRTTVRVKGSDKSLYLSLIKSTFPGQLKMKIIGSSGSALEGNRTCGADYFLVKAGKKYELKNMVRENRNASVSIEFEGPVGCRVIGCWSPDYARDPNCILPEKVTYSQVDTKIRQVASNVNRINVPYISQVGVARTGCESVSSVMMLNSYGYNVTCNDFIDRCLEKHPTADPNCAFVGDPRGNGFGCYAPCIKKAMEKVIDKSRHQVQVKTGTPLDKLVSEHINKGQPVLVWTTMGLRPTKKDSSSWVIGHVSEGARYELGNKFYWQGNEHCVVLVGETKDDYIVNDPHESRGVGLYNKALFKQRFFEQGSQSVVIQPK